MLLSERVEGEQFKMNITCPVLGKSLKHVTLDYIAEDHFIISSNGYLINISDDQQTYNF